MEKYQPKGVNNHHLGFTLIELMVTIAIGGVLLGMAVNSYGTLRESTRVDSAKETIVSMLQQARLRAMSRGENQVIAFDWPGNSVTVGSQTTVFDLIDLKGFRCTGSLDNDVNTDNTFTFTRRGKVTFAGANVGGGPPENLQISSPGSTRAFVIKVNDVTGRIAVVDGLSC